MQHANEMSYLLSICEGTSKASLNPMVFALAPIGTGTDSFVAFAFWFAFVFAFAPRKHHSVVICFFDLLTHLLAAYHV